MNTVLVDPSFCTKKDPSFMGGIDWSSVQFNDFIRTDKSCERKRAINTESGGRLVSLRLIERSSGRTILCSFASPSTRHPPPNPAISESSGGGDPNVFAAALGLLARRTGPSCKEVSYGI
jgi:hypothetical protein